MRYYSRVFVGIQQKLSRIAVYFYKLKSSPGTNTIIFRDLPKLRKSPKNGPPFLPYGSIELSGRNLKWPTNFQDS